MTTHLSPWIAILCVWLLDALIRIRTNKLFLLMVVQRRSRLLAMALLLIVHLIIAGFIYALIHIF